MRWSVLRISVTASFPEMQRLEVIHPLSVESNYGFSVAEEAMYCTVFFSEHQLTFLRCFSFFNGEGKGVIWDSTVPCI